MLEESCAHHRETAQALQRRLSERRQECVRLGKELFRAQESARIANEVADAAERQLNDLSVAYDAIRTSHIQQAIRILQLEKRTLWEVIRDRFDALILKSCESPESYYGLSLAKRDFL